MFPHLKSSTVLKQQQLTALQQKVTVPDRFYTALILIHVTHSIKDKE